MLVSTMSVEEIIDEVNVDLFNISYKVFDSGVKAGKIREVRKKKRAKLNPIKRKDLYQKIDFDVKTEHHNKWKCFVHIFNKCEIWQGYTSVNGTGAIRTVFYDHYNVYFMDTHFFSRYRERYLDANSIVAKSSVDYFNASNQIFIPMPSYLGELQLNEVMVLFNQGVGLGKKINYDSKYTKYSKHHKLSKSNYQVNTFLSYSDLKKTQIESILEYYSSLLDSMIAPTSDSNVIYESMKKLIFLQFETVFPLIKKQYQQYKKQ